MTRALVTISPDDDALAAAKLMGERQIRHLPVVQDGMLLGMVGIRDVLRSLVELLWRDRDVEARETARELLRRSPTVR
jgi:CBS domain-containing protein